MPRAMPTRNVKSLASKAYARSRKARSPRGGRAANRAQRRRSVAVCVEKMQQHKFWNAGAKTVDLNSGLRQECVQGGTNLAMHEKAVALFRFHMKMLQNPHGAMNPSIPCSHRAGGVCKQNVFRDKARIATRNLYRLASRDNNFRATLPWLLSFEVPATTPAQYWLTRVIGAAEWCWLLQADMVEITEPPLADASAEAVTRRIFKPALEANGRSPVITTTDKLFAKLLHEAQVNDPSLLELGEIKIKVSRIETTVAIADTEYTRIEVKRNEVGILSTQVVDKKTKAKPDPGPKLPFGLKPSGSVAPPLNESAAGVYLGPSAGDCDDGGADSSDGESFGAKLREEELDRDAESEGDAPSDADAPGDHTGAKTASSGGEGEAAAPGGSGDKESGAAAGGAALETVSIGKTVGLQAYEFATTNRSVRKRCDGLIPKGCLRIQAKYKISTSLRDTRWAHSHCVKELAPHLLQSAGARVRRWLVDDNRKLSDLEYDTLHNLSTDLTSTSGSASSSHVDSAAKSSAG